MYTRVPSKYVHIFKHNIFQIMESVHLLEMPIAIHTRMATPSSMHEFVFRWHGSYTLLPYMIRYSLRNYTAHTLCIVIIQETMVNWVMVIMPLRRYQNWSVPLLEKWVSVPLIKLHSCTNWLLLFQVVRHVACGNRHSAAVTIEGDLYTWGEGDHGRLGEIE